MEINNLKLAGYKCEACSSLGVYHCAHPEECGGMQPVYYAPNTITDQSNQISDLQSQLSECRKLLATRVEASRLSEANDQISNLKSQLSSFYKEWPGGLSEIEAALRCRDQAIEELESQINNSTI